MVAATPPVAGSTRTTASRFGTVVQTPAAEAPRPCGAQQSSARPTAVALVTAFVAGSMRVTEPVGLPWCVATQTPLAVTARPSGAGATGIVAIRAPLDGLTRQTVLSVKLEIQSAPSPAAIHGGNSWFGAVWTVAVTAFVAGSM